MTDTSDPPVQHDEGDMLTTAYMAGYHKRDDEVRALKAENERLREALAQIVDEDRIFGCENEGSPHQSVTERDGHCATIARTALKETNDD